MKKFILLAMITLIAATPAMGQDIPSDDEILKLITSLETKMESIDKRVDGVSKSVGELETSLQAGLKEQQEQLAAIEALKLQQQQLNARAAEVQAQANEVAATADRQAQQIAGLNSQVSQLQGQAMQLQSQAAEARQQAAANYELAQQAAAQAAQAYNQALAASRAAAPKGPIGKLLNLIPPLRHRGPR